MACSKRSMACSKRSLSSLPLELVEEIFYRTPAESLLRLKFTSKQWYSFISDKRVIYNHLHHHSPERFIRIEQTVQIMDPLTGTRSDLPIPYEFDVMIHCDGLMLCTCSDYKRTKHIDLAIWNPVLRKIKWIEPSCRYKSSHTFGIGYDITSRDNYKILMFTDYFDDQEVEIYQFKTDSWKPLDNKVDWGVDISCKGVSVKGNMYWIVQNSKKFVLSFDFSTETFKEICVCPPSCYSILGCFNGDRLSLVTQDEESREIQVWVTKSLGDGDVSFSKYFNVARPDLPALMFHSGMGHMAHPVFAMGKHKSILTLCEGDVEEDDKYFTCITLYEIDESGIRKQIETERHRGYGNYGSFICGYVYVPSLVPLPG